MATIYKLYNENECYIGSTTQLLRKRLAVHKCGKTCLSREIIKSGNYKIDVVEECSIGDRFIREQYWIDQLSTLKQKKTYLENPEEYKKEYKKNYNVEYNKEYRIANKEKIEEYMKEKISCECGSIYTKQNKARHYKSKHHIDLMKPTATDPLPTETHSDPLNDQLLPKN